MNDKKSQIYVPKYENDALSDVLCLLNLNTTIYHNAKVCGNWQINEHTLGSTCFHIVTLGSCVLNVPGMYEGTLQYGDLVIFPKELPHTMYPARAQTGEQQHIPIHESQHIDGTGILCGEVHIQHAGHRYLLDALPPLLIIPYSEAGEWLQALLKMLVEENNRVGMASKVILDKISELLFTYALRHHLSRHTQNTGIFALYSHPRIARSVRAIHQHPEQSWTLERMAKKAILSRTTFAETFKRISGWTAGQYLTWWRMQLAWSLLKRGMNISETAEKVGYRSDSSFSRAFKKQFHCSAGKIRHSENRER